MPSTSSSAPSTTASACSSPARPTRSRAAYVCRPFAVPLPSLCLGPFIYLHLYLYLHLSPISQTIDVLFYLVILGHLTGLVHQLMLRCADARGLSAKRQRRFVKYQTQVEECGQDINALSRFVNAQVTAFRKILKKYKVCNACAHIPVTTIAMISWYRLASNIGCCTGVYTTTSLTHASNGVLQIQADM